MKIIQSFWSGNGNKNNNNFGWLDRKYHWQGWVLSAHLLTSIYNEVELYTDTYGYDFLINKLQLPYSKVHIVFDDMDYPDELFCVAKVLAYELQEQPFIHVDGDVFLWTPFETGFLKGEIYCQNMENTENTNRKLWDNLKPHLIYVPLALEKYDTGKSCFGFNLGIFGGRNISFIKECCFEALAFIENNISVLKEINIHAFNLFYEQQLFFNMAEKANIDIRYLLHDIDEKFEGLADFEDVPHTRTYLHLLAGYKRNPEVCKRMEVYLLKYFPEAYANTIVALNPTSDYIPVLKTITGEKIIALKNEFKAELINDAISLDKFCLKRDLYNEGLSQQFFDYTTHEKQDLKIILLPCEINIHAPVADDDNFGYVTVQNWDCIPFTYPLDYIGSELIKNLSKPLKYNELLDIFRIQFEDDDQESVPIFTTLFNKILKRYIELNIISLI